MRNYLINERANFGVQHLVFGLYLGEEVFGLDGGSCNITKLVFSRCCKAWDSDMAILVNCLRGASNY